LSSFLRRGGRIFILTVFRYIVVSLYPRVIRSKTYRGYLKPRIIPNALYNVIFV
jgi:hypothetical protein